MQNIQKYITITSLHILGDGWYVTKLTAVKHVGKAKANNNLAAYPQFDDLVFSFKLFA